MKHALVLGGKGNIGRSLVPFLFSKGMEVTNVDIQEDFSEDLRTYSIPSLDSFDVCFFLAWDVGGSKYIDNVPSWLAQYSNNCRIMSNVFPQLVESKVRTLFVSSQLAGSNSTPYSVTKKLGENIALLFENFIVARQWNVYGSDEVIGIRSHVINDFFFQAMNEGIIRLLTSGKEVRSFIHSSDVNRAYLHLTSSKLSGVFDVKGQSPVTILELATMIGRITGATVIPADQDGYSPNVAEYREIPGWRPTKELEEGLIELYEDLKFKSLK